MVSLLLGVATLRQRAVTAGGGGLVFLLMTVEGHEEGEGGGLAVAVTAEVARMDGRSGLQRAENCGGEVKGKEEGEGETIMARKRMIAIMIMALRMS